MQLMEAIQTRHSVRSFTDKKIGGETKDALLAVIEEANAKSGLHIQLILDEPEAFSSMMARYGNFKNCRNYIAIAGKNGSDEAVGYYGEKVVLAAQLLGLNTCWVVMTYSKSKVPCKLEKGEKLQIVIALGYGQTQGVPHKSKPVQSLCRVEGAMPDWFKAGMEAAILAPTAMNQQRFMFSLHGNTVSEKALPAIHSKLDLGIVKYHFEIGAQNGDWSWQQK